MSDMLTNKRNFVRGLIARTIAGGSDESMANFAAARWPWASQGLIAKAAVSAVSFAPDPTAADFLVAARERSVLGKLAFRRIPFNVRLLAMATGARGFWVGEGRPKPLSKPVIEGSVLRPLKCAAIIVVTDESLRTDSDLVEQALGRDLENAVAGALDDAFLSPSNAGIADQTPPSITFGAPSIAASGSDFDALRADLSLLISLYSGELESAALIMSARTAVQIALLAGAAGAIDLSASGGTLFGLPVATTSALGADSGGATIALVDTQAVAVGLDRLTVETSGQTTLLMSDDPANEPGTLVSLFQTDSVAWRAETLANWEVQRTGGVVRLNGVDYA